MKVCYRYLVLLLFFVIFLATLLKMLIEDIDTLGKNVHDDNIYGRYIHPWNSTVEGIDFKYDKKTFRLVKRLNTELDTGRRAEEISEDSYIKHIQPVTATSSNHFLELMAHLHIANKHFPKKKIVVYDLGLKEWEVWKLRDMAYVEYRIFNFTAYPLFMKYLKNYVWKTMVIHRTLCEFGGALWFDSSVVFKSGYLEIVRYMVTKKSSFLFYIRPAGHNIISATKPETLGYLPMRDMNHLIAAMPQASGMLIFNTEVVRQHIYQWIIACALLESCIAPSGSQINGCNDKYPVYSFGGCHRYDQSIFAIVVSNTYNSKVEKYRLPEAMLTFAYQWRLRDDINWGSKKMVIGYVILTSIFFFSIICIACAWCWNKKRLNINRHEQ